MHRENEARRLSYDQLYKDVIKAFFGEFLRLFDPDTAAGIDLSTLTFRDTEVFTDVPQGERRTADIVAEVRTKDGTSELVGHVEDQAELRVQLGQAEGEELMEATELTWAGRIDLEATLRTQRKAIREVVQYRFGQVSPDAQAVIDGTDAEEELDTLFKRALAAQTEQDFLQATR